ncbi:phage tail protein I [Sulfitobacter sp.]|uniref:phage tail protein I n=1 Tax=Sulfitobacter sp. TaxID=1903071 RepID=UPI0030028700
MSDLLSLLPTNRTATEAALEQAIREGQPDLTPIAKLMNPDICPEEHLGWLAWAFSVDVWNPDWSVAVKRETIRTSIKVHRVKGTRGAVRRALESIGFRTDISEWFEHGGDPHTFRVDAYGDDVFAAGFQVDLDLLELVTRMIESLKPVRSHFTLRIGQSFEYPNFARFAVRSRQKIEVDLTPQAPRRTSASELFCRSHIQPIARCTASVRPVPSTRTARSVLTLRSAVQARQVIGGTFAIIAQTEVQNVL